MANENLDARPACPLCGASNKRSDMYCVSCGEWLPWAGGLGIKHKIDDDEPILALILPSLLLPPLGLVLCAIFSLNSPGKARQAGISACVGLGVVLAFYFLYTAL